MIRVYGVETHSVTNGNLEMMKKIKNWMEDHFSAAEPTPPKDLRHSGHLQKPRPVSVKKKAPEAVPPVPDLVDIDTSLHSEIDTVGPGKNVLVRSRYVREETGTHERLMIVNESSNDSGEEAGMDPYNTGSFDRSKNWAQRFRK